MTNRTVFRGVLWIACGALNYGLTYGGLRHAQVNDWPLTQGSRPSAYRSARIVSTAVAITGPAGLGGALVAQMYAGFPGWHIRDWPDLRPTGEAVGE